MSEESNQNPVAKTKESEEKLHYDSLITLFKWIIGSVSIIFVAGSALLGYNVREIKNNVESELELARQEIINLKNEASKEVESIERRTDLKIEEIQKKAYLDIGLSINQRIESELSTPRLQQLIYSQLRNEVAENIEDLVKTEFDEASIEFAKFNRKISSLNVKFSESYVFNSISAIKFIDSVAFNSNDYQLRDIANDMIEKIGSSKIYFFGYKENVRHLNSLKKEYEEYSDLENGELLRLLKKDVLVEKDIEKLTKQFQVIYDLSKGEIMMFNFAKIK